MMAKKCPLRVKIGLAAVQWLASVEPRRRTSPVQAGRSDMGHKLTRRQTLLT